MGYTTASTDDVDSVLSPERGGMWFFRNALGCEQLGLTLLELEPGNSGKQHDHAGSDHEEVYLVVDGEVTVEVDDETVVLGTGEALRVDPETTRRVSNRGDERARVVVAGAP